MLSSTTAPGPWIMVEVFPGMDEFTYYSMYIYLYICTHVCIYIYICICMYMYTYIIYVCLQTRFILARDNKIKDSVAGMCKAGIQ